MGDKEFLGMLIVALGSLVTILVPILKSLIGLNTNLTTLNVTIENLIKKDDEQDKRITDLKKAHYELSDQVKDIDYRVDTLEKVVDAHNEKIPMNQR